MEGSGQATIRGLSDTFDDSNLEYDELDGIPPLPLHILISAGDPFSMAKEKASEIPQVICSCRVLCSYFIRNIVWVSVLVTVLSKYNF